MREHEGLSISSIEKHLISFFHFHFHFNFLLLFKYSCLQFHLTTTPCLTHPRLPPVSLLPLALSMCPLFMFLDNPSPILPHCPLPLPSGYCQFVLYFNVSGYILFACLETVFLTNTLSSFDQRAFFRQACPLTNS